ncbi:hypothetical protein EYZ11_000823 [Aspergillus tanneri]|nr:hypothetical protein EYZ11_000823 [Aspergillus tanneri]
MIEELYYIALPILNEPLSNESRDWRVSALALEAVALQAQQLREAFRPELMDALYPVLQLLASNNANLQTHAMACLNILTASCNYDSTSSMVIENVDYLVNSVALKLNTFDVSPYPPQVLFMMVKLCGARLIPYLDDLVDSIFGILDLYHGYPKLVEMMFKTLAAIVEEGTRSPSFLAIGGDQEGSSVDHHKERYKRLQVASLAEDLAAHKAKRTKYSENRSDEANEALSHPKRPWTMETTESDKPDREIVSLHDPVGDGESDEPLPPPQEPEDQEKPLGKSHNILIHIVKSIPSHLSSPSPYLRRSLLSILIQVSPILAAHENSFLPLINDMWPSVAARITFPSSFGSSSSSNTLMTRNSSDNVDDGYKSGFEEHDFKDEVYVTTMACKAIEEMCKNAGDFMASRVESEFPRWKRIYHRAWEKVSQDAEKAIERRSQQTKKAKEPDLLSSLGLSQSLSLTTVGAPSGARAFTPHHSLWRALLTLFMTLLTHVRLPLSMGDQICEFLGVWIAQFAGPEHYFFYHQQSTETNNRRDSKPPSSLQIDIDSVESAIRTMETWNADLTWFIFQKQRTQVLGLTAQTRTPQVPKMTEVDEGALKAWSMPGSGLKFVDLVF